MHYEFEPGDIVRILNPYDGPSGLVRDIGVNDEMERMVGEEHAISELPENDIHGHQVYRLEGCQWVWAPEWLELADQSHTIFEDSEFDEVFN